LAAATELAKSRVKLVAAVRANFYNACAQVPWLAGKISNNQVLVGPMSESELRRAITEPARRAGLHLEQGLFAAVIEEAGSEAGSLPLMAHALVETWVRRRGNTLRQKAMRRICCTVARHCSARWNGDRPIWISSGHWRIRF
jgi:hypothetical protein